MSGPVTGDSTQPSGGKFASLGPMLLARKGSAKPAMRAQLDAGSRCVVSDLADFSADPIDQLSAAQDDLGWNDMGDDRRAEGAALPVPAEPEVKRQQDLLVNRIADANLAALQAAPKAIDSAEASPVRRNPRAAIGDAADSRRAAFTLRLDNDRHLRLRLASTIEGESAQALVTRALDEFLARLPEIENLAAQVRRPATKA